MPDPVSHIFESSFVNKKVSLAVSDHGRTRGKAPIFQASASCGSLPLLSTPSCSATINAASHERLGRPVWADLFLNRRPGGCSPDYFLGFDLSGISRFTDETTAHTFFNDALKNM